VPTLFFLLIETKDCMTIIIWDQEKLSVGVQLLDEQHKKLVELINALYLLKENKGEHVKTGLSKLFDRFKDYSIYHFKAEEEYFSLLDSKAVELHILQHKHYLEYLQELSVKVRENNDLSEEMLFHLTDWIFHHILSEDKKYLNTYKSC